jgi:transposase-like protein
VIQTLLQKAFGVTGPYQYERTEYLYGAVQFYLRLKTQAVICPRCKSGGHVIRRGGRYRALQTVPIGLKAVYLMSEVVRCLCRRCESTFEVHPPLPGRTSGIPASSNS